MVYHGWRWRDERHFEVGLGNTCVVVIFYHSSNDCYDPLQSSGIRLAWPNKRGIERDGASQSASAIVMKGGAVSASWDLFILITAFCPEQ